MEIQDYTMDELQPQGTEPKGKKTMMDSLQSSNMRGLGCSHSVEHLLGTPLELHGGSSLA